MNRMYRPNSCVLDDRDGGIMCQNSANYVQHFLGLCAPLLPICVNMCAIFRNYAELVGLCGIHPIMRKRRSYVQNYAHA